LKKEEQTIYRIHYREYSDDAPPLIKWSARRPDGIQMDCQNDSRLSNQDFVGGEESFATWWANL
jgi:hypothetical protein